MKNVFLKIFFIALVFQICAAGQSLYESKVEKQDDNLSLTATSKLPVDIRQIVKQQIENAKLYEINSGYRKSLSDVIEVESKNYNNTVTANIDKTDFIKNIDLRIIIITAIGFLSFIIILMRRRKLNRNIGNDEDDELLSLKTKIAMIRNEEPLVIDNSGLSKVRRGLREKPITVNDELNGKSKKALLNTDKSIESLFDKLNNDISKTAKQFKISKGEILLASKIRSFEMDKACSIK